MIVDQFEVHQAFAEDLVYLGEEHGLLLRVVVLSWHFWTSGAQFVVWDGVIVDSLHRRVDLVPWPLHLGVLLLYLGQQGIVLNIKRVPLSR